MNERKVVTDDYTVTFKNTIANSMLFTKMAEWANSDESLTGLRNQFAYIASHIEKWEGGGWKPPKSAEPSELTKSFDAFIMRFSLEQMRELSSAVDTLHSPIANAVAKPDKALSGDELSDPN